MLIDQINLNQLRVFESVFRTKSMTHAARELHLTQSGVSQHIKALEDVLELKLFDRIKQKLVPTPSAKELYKHTSRSFEEIETILNRLKKTDKELTGVVSIGLPIEFGNNIVIPLLSEFQKKNPKVQFRIRQGFPFEMNHLLLGGELDFAFVDSFAMDKGVTTQPVYDEVLELCVSKKLGVSAKGVTDPEFYQGLTYVDYQEEQSVLSMWMKHHAGMKAVDLDVRLYVMDAQAISKMILSGAGAGVLPGHLADKLVAAGEELQIMKGSGKPLHNTISIAYLEEKTLTPAAKSTFDFLKSNILKK
ncbi:MAG: LysR family transcriptional regulator [Bdellovibrionales bacterium]|nr:LysR family transcriptional regulator [Bdellovibrionales bacterium]